MGQLRSFPFEFTLYSTKFVSLAPPPNANTELISQRFIDKARRRNRWTHTGSWWTESIDCKIQPTEWTIIIPHYSNHEYRMHDALSFNSEVMLRYKNDPTIYILPKNTYVLLLAFDFVPMEFRQLHDPQGPILMRYLSFSSAPLQPNQFSLNIASVFEHKNPSNK